VQPSEEQNDVQGHALNLRWLAAGRGGLLLLSLLSAFVTSRQDSELGLLAANLFIPLLSILGFSLVSLLWIRKGMFAAYTQLVTDVVMVTGAVYVTGGAISPFLFLYLTPVMIAALFFSRRTALIIAGVGSAAYSILMYALIDGWILTARGELFNDTPVSDVFLQIIGLSSAMVLIGVLTSYLSRRLRSTTELVQRSSEDLAINISKLREVEGKLQIQEEMARLLSAKSAPVGSGHYGSPHFVGESQVMRKIFALIERVAPSDATVLISGESGTGKELVARAIHEGSSRKPKPFVPVNCGAIPENLIESELFGHKKGSFTSAESDHTGLFRQAEGGTIFLDEIGELPIHMQTKLLRTIQQKSVRPVGGDRDIAINVRIVAATNRNLKKEITEARFREDLFYRLNVININLPPLRERKEDLPLLINTTLKRMVKGNVTPVIPPATMDILLQYRYPGNVRELENLMERAIVLGGEVILPEHLPESVRSFQLITSDHPRRIGTEIIIDENIELPIKLDDLLGTIERRYLEVALVKTNGARKKAADLLGMNFRSFRYRLQKFGIRDEE